MFNAFWEEIAAFPEECFLAVGWKETHWHTAHAYCSFSTASPWVLLKLEKKEHAHSIQGVSGSLSFSSQNPMLALLWSTRWTTCHSKGIQRLQFHSITAFLHTNWPVFDQKCLNVGPQHNISNCRAKHLHEITRVIAKVGVIFSRVKGK